MMNIEVICPDCGKVISLERSGDQPLLFNMVQEPEQSELTALGILFGEEVNDDE